MADFSLFTTPDGTFLIDPSTGKLWRYDAGGLTPVPIREPDAPEPALNGAPERKAEDCASDPSMWFFDFSIALNYLKSGHKVRRRAWAPVSYLRHRVDDDGFAWLAYCEGAHRLRVHHWSPSPGDLLAADWLLVE